MNASLRSPIGNFKDSSAAALLSFWERVHRLNLPTGFFCFGAIDGEKPGLDFEPSILSLLPRRYQSFAGCRAMITGFGDFSKSK